MIIYIPHCDESNCDLGVVEYFCPACQKDCTSYDLSLYQRLKNTFTCEDCSSKLCVKEINGTEFVFSTDGFERRCSI